MRKFLACFLLVFACFAGVAFAQTAPVIDEDEIRARNIGQQLRCVVCQNQSIEDSNAPLAEDMRTLVRRRIAAGDSDSEVRAYLQSRYGDFVLMRPPVQTNTALLWGGPLFFLMVGGVIFVLAVRAQPSEEDAE